MRVPRLLTLVLLGCATAEPSREVPNPVEPEPSWSSVVFGKIAVEQREILPGPEGYSADLAAVGLVARFDNQGVRFGDAIGDILGIRLERWGREGALRPAAEARPRTGACGLERGAEDQCLHRMEVTRDEGLVEWWLSQEQGVEQGWTVEAAPGEGPLMLEVRVEGASDLRMDGDGAAFVDDSGRMWAVSGVQAWDADGEALAAMLEVEEGLLRLVVDTDGARWPVTVDPVYTTAATTLTGGAGEYFGTSVAGAGDVNGDGYGDVIVGAPIYSSIKGRAYVFMGSSAGVSTTAAVTYTGTTNSSYLGQSVAGAGDVNGDGYDDVVVGAYGVSSEIGAVYVYYGSATGLPTTASVTLNGKASYSGCTPWFGYSVAGVGDVNHDGYDDVAVGAADDDSNSNCNDVGRIFVYHGSSGGLSTTAASTLTGASTNSFLGWSVDGAGDVNGDTYDDLIGGAYYVSSGAGAAYVYHGSASGIGSTAATTLSGSASSFMGASVSGAGDVNGDGYEDVIVGAYRYNSYAGRAMVYKGSATGISTTVATTLTGSASSYLGYSVAGIGDINHDGYGDLAVGAFAYSSNAGAVYVYEGGSSGISTTATTTLSGAVSASLGQSVSGAGDVNGDGYDDLIVGAPRTTSNAGAAHIYYGYAPDGDGDGVPADQDCNDADAGIGAPSIWYQDLDGDSYGNLAVTTTACSAPSGYVANSSDCNDGSASISPGAAEICDGSNTDEDCDGLADDRDPSATGQGSFYQDADGDSYGAAVTSACDLPSGYVSMAGDCDDGNAAISPAAQEICDAADTDEDCDGLVDDADPSVSSLLTWYADTDGDTYGNVASTVGACEQPSGYLADFQDCDDSRADVNPSAQEVCDAADVDENCDGLADDADFSATGQGSYYLDQDGDGYGDPTMSLTVCDPPTGYVANAADCNDGDGAIRPDATEICDAADVDENCNGLADDADNTVDPASQSSWYADVDGDRFGYPNALTRSCEQPAGTVVDATDCDDGRSDVYPGAQEVCDATNTDEDCDGTADDADLSAIGQSSFYADADQDGYGDANVPALACDTPAGMVTDATDCNDAANAIHPGAAEICDAADVDENCNTLADDGDPSVDPASYASWYADNDGDTYGDPASGILSCDPTGGRIADATDCDDSRSDVNPGAQEICDALHTDEDCDGLADDADSSVDPSTFGTWYADSDADGYGNAGQSSASCDLPAGSVTDASDCDDARNDIHPGAPESDCSDPTDYNCDGSVGFADADTDGTPACQDCNDADGAISPNAQEICDADNTDEDCDGLTDDADSSVDPSGFSSGYGDSDGDGYGAGSLVSACDPGDVIADGTDCDDARGDIHPNASEEDCTDPTDYNCDGSVGYADADGDGTAACEDCNDNDGAISPAESERCNQVDDNCDGTVDEGNVCDSTGGQDSDPGTVKGGTCGCSTQDGDASGWAGLVVLLAAVGRRRRG